MRITAAVLALAAGVAALIGAWMVSPFPTGALDITSDGPSLPSTLLGLLAAATAIASAMVGLKARYVAAVAVLLAAAAAQLVAMAAAGAQPLPVSGADYTALGLLIGSVLLFGVVAIGRRIRLQRRISA